MVADVEVVQVSESQDEFDAVPPCLSFSDQSSLYCIAHIHERIPSTLKFPA
jgi:hypothetical protein